MQASDFVQYGVIGAILIVVGMFLAYLRFRPNGNGKPHVERAGEQSKDYYDNKFDKLLEGNERLLEELKLLRVDMKEVFASFLDVVKDDRSRIGILEEKLSFIRAKHLN